MRSCTTFRAAGFSLRDSSFSDGLGAASDPEYENENRYKARGSERRLAKYILTAAVLLAAWPILADEARGQSETIQVDLKLRTGGALTGLVVDHTDHGIVVVAETTPYVFSWDEIETGSAYVAKRDLLALERGGREHLTAGDYFSLGQFALSRGRNSLATDDLRKAARLDPDYEPRVRKAFDDYRKRGKRRRSADDRALGEIEGVPEPAATGHGLVEEIGTALSGGEGTDGADRIVGTNAEIRAKAMEVYRIFGQRVRETIDKKLVLIETDHFLIWTDWEKQKRGLLARWCESMYAALCRQFDFDPSESVFLAKCPVFCWRSKARFRRFARGFDGFEGKNALGYSRSIAANGHVHIVLLRDGRSDYAYDRFAATLVHEGTHAFVHRLHTTRLIPHWVNEGYADLMAERVLGDRCPNAENAALLARQYVLYDWPIGGLLRKSGTIPVHEYALAHSVVAHLESSDKRRFAGFIKSLKYGDTLSGALAANYEGLTPQGLEQRWRESVRRNIPERNQP